MYQILLHSHLTAVLLSFFAFFIRGILMMREAPSVNHRAFLIVPQIINICLIGTGIALVINLGLSPSTQPWLAAKLTALVVYIILGVLTFKHPKLQVRKILWLVALFIFAYMVSVAHSKNSLGFFAGIL